MDIYTRPILMQAALLVFQSITYFGIQRFEGPAHNVARPIDERIPFVPQMIFVYVLWYPLIAIFPIILYHASAADYHVYMMSILLDIVISLIIYIVYPTSFQRPKPPGQSISGRILKLVHRGNYKGKNCMPSMHSSMCFIIMISAAACGDMLLCIRVTVFLMAALIVVSTVMTKQHVLIDVITALPVSVICCLIGYQACRIGGVV